MEPSAVLLASPPRDSAFQMVPGILESSGSMGPTGSLAFTEPKETTHSTGLVSTAILEDEPDSDGGWVIEGKESQRASKGHHLIVRGD